MRGGTTIYPGGIGGIEAKPLVVQSQVQSSEDLVERLAVEVLIDRGFSE